MPQLIDLPSFIDERGTLTVIEKIIPFDIKRVYYIYDVVSDRGGHRHIKNIQATVCLNGECEVHVNDGEIKKSYLLNNPAECLILYPQDWHVMANFSPGAVLLVLCSEYYENDDYIEESYPDD